MHYSVKGATPEQTANFGHQVAQGTIRDQDYKSFLQLGRSRVLQNTTRFSATLEVLSRNGQTVNRIHPLVFPEADGGYDDRDKVGQERGGHALVACQPVVRHDQGGAPTDPRREAPSVRFDARAHGGRPRARDGTESDLPADMLPPTRAS